MTVADNCCNRQAGMCMGLVWEHYNEDWDVIVPHLDLASTPTENALMIRFQNVHRLTC